MKHTIEVDTIDPHDFDFQNWLTDHGITAEVVDEVGPGGGNSVVRYTGETNELLAMLATWFGDEMDEKEMLDMYRPEPVQTPESKTSGGLFTEKELRAKAGNTNSQLTVRQVVAEAKKRRALVESSNYNDCSSSPSSQTPLTNQFRQYIKNGDSYSPVGPVTLVDSLPPCPFEIVQNMSGVVFERVKPVTDEILRFNDSKMQKVVAEIDRFWERKDDYTRLGLMHNRGILLYGPPGTGKSICMQQVVEMMANRGDIVFVAKSPSAIAEGMKALRQIEPDRKVVVSFEEADEMCRFNEREMLRIMDGDAKVQGVLFLATTNYIDRLPPRMLRPGRFDRKEFIGYPTTEQRIAYLRHKLRNHQDVTEAELNYMARQTEGLGFGHLRELVAGVYAIGDSLDDVLSRLREANSVTESADPAVASLLND